MLLFLLSYQFEAEKYKQLLSIVKDRLNDQINWLRETDESLIKTLNTIIYDRYVKELSATNVLFSMIRTAIVSANQLEELWMVTADAVPVNPILFRNSSLRKFAAYLPVYMKPKTNKEDDGDDNNADGQKHQNSHHHHHHHHYNADGTEDLDYIRYSFKSIKLI